jgi:predicted Co/Zn/Cd cation transporter (cation efflux family)
VHLDRIENKGLWVTVAANLVMATAGWITFKFTGSQAMLLDGNFSFVLAVATFIAIFISKNKHKKTSTFPFGSYVYEAAFVLSKGLLILGIIIMAFIQNLIRIIQYFQGVKVQAVVLTPIYYYTGFILVFTLALLWFFNRQNKLINHQSSILLVEAESAKVDGALTLVTGLAFFLISFVVVGSKMEFLLYIGDALIVVAMSLIIVRTPVHIIRNAFIELGGGTIQNQQEKQRIEKIVGEIILDAFSFQTYITKLGTWYLVVIYVEPREKSIDVEQYKAIQNKIKKDLQHIFPTISVEITLN